MLRNKFAACLLVVSLGTVAVAAPLGVTAAKGLREGMLANSPLGRLLTGNLGRLMGLRSELNLSDQQRDQIKAILAEHKSEIATAAKGVWAKRSALRDAALDESGDEAAIRKAAEELGKAVGDAAVLGSKIKSQVAPLLTDQQKALVKQCRSDCQGATARFFEEAVKAQ